MKKEIKELLDELEKTVDVYWNVGKEVGEFLHNLILENNIKTVFEIGTSNGYSGLWMIDALIQTGGKLYTIESHKKGRFYLAKDNFEKVGVQDFVEQILGHAPEGIPSEPKKFDMSLFDGTKSQHIGFFEAMDSRINIGGYIITDNVISHEKELTEYIEKIKANKNWESYILDIGKGIMISKKIA